MAIESHEFTVEPGIIMHLILSQAGSCGKAVLECAMNSVDALASSIRIDVDAERMTIRDDGHGLRSREEILAVFKRFGFDHSGHTREFGKFGLGRGQLWAFCRTIWRSHHFALDVDVRARGLKWFLDDGAEHVDGLTIEAEFYEPLTAVALVDLTSEIERLCRYSTVPVHINGRQVNKDPEAQKWTVTTDEAYVRISEGNYLSVYNQGMLVTEMYAGRTGVAGTLVTKRGHNLSLNMARNDVQRDCPLWKKLSALCAKEAAGRTGRTATKRITDADRDYLAHQTADPSRIDSFDKPIFTLSTGKNLSLTSLLSQVSPWRGKPLSVAPTGHRMAETLIRDKLAVVLADRTLERFGVCSVAELLDLCKSRLEAASPSRTSDAGHNLYLLTLGRCTVYEQVEQCPGYKQLQASRIPTSQLNSQQRQFIAAAQKVDWEVSVALRSFDRSRGARRDIILGKGEGIHAYTDGSSYIALCDTFAAAVVRDGFAGWLRVAHTLVHEYLHHEDDSGSHAHDLEFMQSFHDITLEQGAQLFTAARKGFEAYTKGLARLTRKQASNIDIIAAHDRATAAIA